MSEYLWFYPGKSKSGKTRVIEVTSKSQGYNLGYIKWYGPWRQYVFEVEGVIFNAGCLRDIINRIETEMREWRDKRK